MTNYSCSTALELELLIHWIYVRCDLVSCTEARVNVVQENLIVLLVLLLRLLLNPLRKCVYQDDNFVNSVHNRVS